MKEPKEFCNVCGKHFEKGKGSKKGLGTNGRILCTLCPECTELIGEDED
jgi:hypothetical protein